MTTKTTTADPEISALEAEVSRWKKATEHSRSTIEFLERRSEQRNIVIAQLSARIARLEGRS